MTVVPDLNQLLGRLPRDDRSRIGRQLDRVDIGREVIYDGDADFKRVLFPMRGLFSVVAEMENGATLEVASIGSEGITAVVLFLGRASARQRVISVIAGESYAMSAAAFSEESETCAALGEILRAYAAAFLAQVTQNVACNGSHRMSRRLARWLLVAHDAAQRDDLVLTQDVMAQMLGVQRPSVSLMAEALRDSGAISYRRGHIRVLDRQSLERSSCECYAIVKQEFARAFD